MVSGERKIRMLRLMYGCLTFIAAMYFALCAYLNQQPDGGALIALFAAFGTVGGLAKYANAQEHKAAPRVD